MNIQILISKKGTQVVTATNLHDVLDLPLHKYNSNIKRWVSDIYAFKDDVRKPEIMHDYALRSSKGKREDYYISLELAKLITLNSNSLIKAELAKYFLSLCKKEEKEEMLTKDQVLAVLELTKVMGMISCQKSVEKQHQNKYNEAQGKPYEWWKYRANLLGYSVQELKDKMHEVGQNYKSKNLLQLLMHLDKYEIIRMAVIDLFLALGKSEKYAKDMGDLAKVFAREMKVEIWDDRKSDIKFTHNVNMELVQEVKGLQNEGETLGLWSHRATA